MFCKNCGSEINDQAFICIKCGAKVKNETYTTKTYTGITLGIVAASIEAFQLLLMLTTIINYNKYYNPFGYIITLVLFYIPCTIAVFTLSVVGTVFGFKFQNKTGSILNVITLVTCIIAFVGFILYFSYNPNYNYYY